MTTDAVGAAIAEATGLLARARRVGVVGHINPDGDALGSIIGLALGAQDAGKEVVASFGDPFAVPRQFRFLDLSLLVPAGEFPDELDVVVACDTADEERLGNLADAARSARHLVVVDHHRSNGGFGDVAVIDPEAAATTQLVYYLLEQLGWEVGPSAATALYTGLVTDTGRFQYSATTAEVHRVAGALIAAGAEPDRVGRYLYEEAPFPYFEVVARVLGRARLDEEQRLVWSVLYRADLEEAGIAYEDTDALIDLVRLAEEAEVACLLKVLDQGVTSGSLRSRGRVDVSEIAAALGGGGHHNAAGFTYQGDPEEAIGVVRSLL